MKVKGPHKPKPHAVSGFSHAGDKGFVVSVCLYILFSWISHWVLVVIPWQWWNSPIGLLHIFFWNGVVATLCYCYRLAIITSPGGAPMDWVRFFESWLDTGTAEFHCIPLGRRFLVRRTTARYLLLQTDSAMGSTMESCQTFILLYPTAFEGTLFFVGDFSKLSVTTLHFPRRLSPFLSLHCSSLSFNPDLPSFPLRFLNLQKPPQLSPAQISLFMEGKYNIKKIGGVAGPFEPRWCAICENFKPPRAHHCKELGTYVFL